ncbi:DNA methyltransferase [Caulobacter phage CcrColossus]|uniref:Putative DNA methylase n=1 Tax=Caulobacter phage CcrColossus TaxID=1211640 RepID=K4K691_9CAUD|nr:DNA methyltransferase [Caulobacter phage CcrColossus]AFU88032.1 putative DNA methylase [Caulobacter phage CcrColossus]
MPGFLTLSVNHASYPGMAITDTGRKDPSMLGGTNYARAPLDHYPTPARATNAYVSVVEDDLEAMQFWEPFAGNGAIYHIIKNYCRSAGATDIVQYDGLDLHGLVDFFSIYPDGEAFDSALAAWERLIDKNTGDDGVWLGAEPAPVRPRPFSEITEMLGFTPDCIISNPPYGKDTDRAVRKALELMEAQHGYVAFLMRHEWDAAKGRADLIDHPAFAAKITLRFRPVWVEKKEGEKSASPRFSYAFYVWDWQKAQTLPHAKAEMFYAG